MTQADPPPPIALSLPEIRALATKAARGAGMPWGLAEEAGLAVAGLARMGLPGARWLRALLCGPATSAPVVAIGRWHPNGMHQCVCPIKVGAALADHAKLREGLGEQHRLLVERVAVPGLVLPFLGQVAARLSCGLQVDWTDGSALIGPDGWCRVIAGESCLAASVADLAITKSNLRQPPDRLVACSATLMAAELQGLEALALATTVPPSEKSRTDAGAAGSDNE